MPDSSGLSSLLVPDLKRVFVETGKEFPPEYPVWCNVEDMDWQGEKEYQLSGLGTMPNKPEGTAFTTDEPITGGTRTYTANPFGLAIEITWEMWRDDLYGVMVELIQSLARAGRNREETDAHHPLNNAFSTSFVGFTASEALVQTSHSNLDGSTQNNTPTTSQSFGLTYLQGAMIRFENLTDDRGLPRRLSPRLVIIDSSNRFVAREILGSAHKPFTADNEINSLLQDDLSWMVNHYLTTATYHFLLAGKGNHDISFRWRDRPIFDMFDDPRSRVAVATVYQRHTRGGFGSWKGIDGSGN